MQTLYHGQSLEEAINTVHPERQPLIENLLYEKSALLLYADDGIGKSTLCLQLCMSATVAETKAFGEFEVSRPSNILYFQMERHPDETFERMKHLVEVVPFDKSRFALSVDLQGINLQDKKDFCAALVKVSKAVTETGFTPDVIAFDPIYTLANDGLETAKACNSITNFFRSVQIVYACTILATSHTNRGVRDPENPKGKRVGQDMYGNRFLSAFFTGSYHIMPKGSGAGSLWQKDKNSLKNLEDKIELVYDAARFYSTTTQTNKFTKKERLDNYLKACKMSDKVFGFGDMQDASGLSDSPLRGYLTGYLKEKLDIVSKSNNGKILYRVRY